MALNIKDPEADRLARELARRRGETITQAVIAALREQLGREKARKRPPGMAAQLMEIGRRYSSLPVLDDRRDDEILGYDDNGLPR
jgi:antitoxin VapB